jgi:hypothetical protein
MFIFVNIYGILYYIIKKIGGIFMPLKQKIRLFVALISLLYCVSLIQSTYAKYITSADANANISIARWNVLVNGQDVKNNSDFSSKITPVFAGNDNMAANIIAPTATGYFDIIINGTSTDVSFTYNVTLTNDKDNQVKDLTITKYTVDSGSEEQLTNNLITGNVLLNDTNKTHTIRVYVKWNDDTATETMDNTSDTNATNNGKAIMDVNVNLIQKAN